MNQTEHTNHVEIRKNITGSFFFDMPDQMNAAKLCELFPELKKEEYVDENGIRWIVVKGELSDFSYKKYCDFIYQTYSY